VPDAVDSGRNNLKSAQFNVNSMLLVAAIAIADASQTAMAAGLPSQNCAPSAVFWHKGSLANSWVSRDN
jgi:hypothetical protein